MALCTCENISFYYPQMNQPTLENINVTIEEGDFIVICGQSGCGKTTLLRHLKPALTPHGKMTGCIRFEGQDIYQQLLTPSSIGYVMQHPSDQIVTDKVWHELSFGLENMGVSSLEIRRRTAEMATFFGIESLFHQSCDTLSGGQKQLLNLASIMVMQPKLLLLDEPTSQLDPIAAKEFLGVLRTLNEEFGTTIVMVEHHLEEAFTIADRIVVMEEGKILCDERVSNITNALHKKARNHPIFEGFPTAIRIYEQFPIDHVCPIKIKEGKQFLKTYFHKTKSSEIETVIKRKPYISAQELYFRYDQKGNDILKGLTLQVAKQDIYAILGANGAGKSTLLQILCGQQLPQRGTVSLNETRIVHRKKAQIPNTFAYIPQDPAALFIKDEVMEDLAWMCKVQKDQVSAHKRMDEWIDQLHLRHLLHRHPYDLSGGEQQRYALCKVLMKDIEVVLLDEPTKGLDAFAKKELGEIFRNLRKNGITLIIVSHDVEFVAQYATWASLLFDGEMIAEGDVKSFFKENQFYTTAAHKMARDVFPDAITCEDVITQCMQNQM